MMNSYPLQRDDNEDEEDKYSSDEELRKKFQLRCEDALVQHFNSLKRQAF